MPFSSLNSESTTGYCCPIKVKTSQHFRRSFLRATRRQVSKMGTTCPRPVSFCVVSSLYLHHELTPNTAPVKLMVGLAQPQSITSPFKITCKQIINYGGGQMPPYGGGGGVTTAKST